MHLGRVVGHGCVLRFPLVQRVSIEKRLNRCDLILRCLLLVGPGSNPNVGLNTSYATAMQERMGLTDDAHHIIPRPINRRPSGAHLVMKSTSPQKALNLCDFGRDGRVLGPNGNEAKVCNA